ncbi:MAG: hypothetical protein IPK06_09740 [Ignavibacteriae bacterium]|nr:hypothetical protein [Ignavibacteriota bacterium]
MLSKEFPILENLSNKLIYSEAQDNNDKNENYKYDKLVLYDLSKGERIYLSDGNSLTKEGIISNDLNKITLLSAINNDPILQKIQGVGADLFFYEYSLEIKQWICLIEKEDLNKNNVSTRINHINYNNNGNILFSTYGKIFQYDFIDKKMIELFVINNNYHIDNFNCNYNNKLFLIQYSNENDWNDTGIMIYSLEKDSVLVKISPKSLGTEIGNFSPNNKNICYLDSAITIFNIENNIYKNVTVKNNDKIIKPIKCKFLNEKELIIIASYKHQIQDAFDVFKYNLLTKELLQITNDRKYKDYLFCNYN